jgi:hypothetical protein
MRPWVKEADLPAEYERLRKVVHRARLYKESESLLPGPEWAEKKS